MEGLLLVQYGAELGSVGNGIDLFVAGALSVVSCALSFLFRCYIEVFRSWLICLGATRVFVARQEYVVAGELHTCVCHHIPWPDAQLWSAILFMEGVLATNDIISLRTRMWYAFEEQVHELAVLRRLVVVIVEVCKLPPHGLGVTVRSASAMLRPGAEGGIGTSVCLHPVTCLIHTFLLGVVSVSVHLLGFIEFLSALLVVKTLPRFTCTIVGSR